MKKRLMINTIAPVVLQLLTIVCGLILPRLYLVAYGSEVNGLVSSVSQFLSVISLLDMGVSSVVQAAFYQPVAKKDMDGISKIYLSSRNFFRKIAYIFLGYIVFVIVFFVYKSLSSFSTFEIALLIIIIASSLFVQYYFGLTDQILLNSDQYIYIQSGLQCILLVVNVAICYMLIELGFGIIVIRGISAIVFIFRPFILRLFVKKHYNLSLKIQFDGEPIKQKWDGASQFIANYVLTNTDVIILTFFSTFENVSIYTVYNNVAYGLRQLVMAMGSGFQSLWGNLLAKKENEQLNKSFDFFEWFLHNAVTVLFVTAFILIIPFIQIYTKGVSDANYINPLFGHLLIIANAVSCYRLPYIAMIYAAGQFKETQISAWIEMFINLVLSIILVNKFQLIGVAIGTLISMMYRTIYLAYYLRNNIINRRFSFFLRRALIDGMIVFIVLLINRVFVFDNISIIGWVVYGIKVLFVSGVIMIFVNWIFDRTRMKNYMQLVIKKSINKGAN